MSLITYLANFKKQSDMIARSDMKTHFILPRKAIGRDFRSTKMPPSLEKYTSSLTINLLGECKYGNSRIKFIDNPLYRGSLERGIFQKNILLKIVPNTGPITKAAKALGMKLSNPQPSLEHKAISATSDQRIVPAKSSIETSVPRPPYFWSKKLIEWVLTAPNVYEFALTVLHNISDVCFQNPENRSFIDSSLIPRIRFMRFTTSAAAGTVYHVAIGILFTPFVMGTLGKKESINHIWYGYWAGASLSTIGIFTGLFGVVTGNFLIKKVLQEHIPHCKNYLNSCLSHIQSVRTEANKVNINQLKTDLNSADTVDEMVLVLQRLVSIVRRASCKKV